MTRLVCPLRDTYAGVCRSLFSKNSICSGHRINYACVPRRGHVDKLCALYVVHMHHIPSRLAGVQG